MNKNFRKKSCFTKEKFYCESTHILQKIVNKKWSEKSLLDEKAYFNELNGNRTNKCQTE